jgi:cytochrome c oxidase subunit IV
MEKSIKEYLKLWAIVFELSHLWVLYFVDWVRLFNFKLELLALIAFALQFSHKFTQIFLLLPEFLFQTASIRLESISPLHLRAQRAVY